MVFIIPPETICNWIHNIVRLSVYERVYVRGCDAAQWVLLSHWDWISDPTLNMRILTDHVTYSFLAFPKSIF